MEVSASHNSFLGDLVSCSGSGKNSLIKSVPRVLFQYDLGSAFRVPVSTVYRMRICLREEKLDCKMLLIWI